MNGFTKRIAGVVAAGMLTVSGVAVITQPAYAADKAPAKGTPDKFVKTCTATGGEWGAVASGPGSGGVSCGWDLGVVTVSISCGVDGGKIQSCHGHLGQVTTPLRKVTVRTTGVVIVTTAGTRTVVKTSAATGITTVTTPGSAPMVVLPHTAVTGPGSPVVKPVTPVAQPTPTPTTPTRPATGIVVRPGGAIG